MHQNVTELWDVDTLTIHTVFFCSYFTAVDDWTGRKEYDPYLNRMRIKLQVIKGHILLSPTARDVLVTGNRYDLFVFCIRTHCRSDITDIQHAHRAYEHLKQLAALVGDVPLYARPRLVPCNQMLRKACLLPPWLQSRDLGWCVVSRRLFLLRDKA